MSATAISLTKRQEIWKSTITPGETDAISPLLELAFLQTHAGGAYVYRFDRPNAEAALIAFAGPAPKSNRVSGELASLHWNRKTPVVLRSLAAADRRFSGFPEMRSGQFDGVASVPLLDAGNAVGLANFCLTGDAPLSASALSFLMSLSLPLGALLVASSLRRQLETTQEQLANRKTMERAKGILQARFGWTEEEAYLRMRRLSRQNRTPLREIAQFIIECRVELRQEAFQ